MYIYACGDLMSFCRVLKMICASEYASVVRWLGERSL